jgi:hypothetical protein
MSNQFVKINNPHLADVIGDSIKPSVERSGTLGLVITMIKAIIDSDRNTQPSPLLSLVTRAISYVRVLPSPHGLGFMPPPITRA